MMGAAPPSPEQGCTREPNYACFENVVNRRN
jgi:hypothetical protein